jgi:hypothetical protein
MPPDAESERVQILFHHQRVVRPAPSAADQDPNDHGLHPVVAQVEHGRANKGRVERRFGIGFAYEKLDNVRFAAHLHTSSLQGREDRDAAAMHLIGEDAAVADTRIPTADEAHREPNRI